MKKYLVCVLTIGMFFCQPVFGMSQVNACEGVVTYDVNEASFPRASEYIVKYNGSLVSNEKGKLAINGSVVSMDTTGAKITVQLQVKEGSQWKNYNSAYTASAKNTKVAIEKEITASSGKSYRAKFTFDVLKNGTVVESRSITTSSTTVK